MPKVSLATEALRSKDDSDKENVRLLHDESIQKGEFVGDGPSNTIESRPKDSLHSCDHPLAERTQVVILKILLLLFYKDRCLLECLNFSTSFFSLYCEKFQIYRKVARIE